ncbi:MAG: DUF47 family protein [archaeon]|nr:DUF47 family protein [archaeon]
MKKDNKIEKKSKLQDLFNKDAELLEEIINSMAKSMDAFCKGNDDLNKHIEQTIQSEKKQDRLREEILDRLFGRETMVFSRPDRLKMVNQMDDVADKAETIVRRLQMYKPNPQKELIEGINWMGKKIGIIGSKLKELIIAVFNDFNKAKPFITEINDLRREIRSKEYELLNILFKVKPDYADFVFFEDMITNLTKVANNAEDFSDDIYGLICKYTLG